MKTSLLFALALGAPFVSPSLRALENPQDTRNVLNKWVETRQLISKENSDWKLEEAILSDTKALLSDELERLDLVLKDLNVSATAADEERSQLASKKEQLKGASSVVEQQIGTLEIEMKAIIKTLPTPLIDKIKPLIRRLPEDSNDTKLSMGERVQNIVGILSQAEKFNSTVTATSESREIAAGKVVEVRTLYWGLAMAYYVDASGEYAGIGFPGAENWEWPKIEGSGPAIQQLINVYEGSADIQFVKVPARIN